MRDDIDRVDAALIVLLSQRYAIVQAIARLKRDAGDTLVDEPRETTIKERARLLGARFGLGDYGRDLITLCIACCRGAFQEQPARRYPREPHPKPGSRY